MSSIPFDYRTENEIREALDSLRCNHIPPASTDCGYLKPLRELAEEFKQHTHEDGYSVIGRYGLERALYLARGEYSDIVFIFLEPTDGSAGCSPEDMIEKSHTMRWFREVLDKASGGKRNLENSRILTLGHFEPRN